jgi:hypothetical protein
METLRSGHTGERDGRVALWQSSSMLQTPLADANRSSAPAAFAANASESTATKLARIEAAVYAQVRSGVGVGASGTEPSLGTAANTADGGSHDGDGTVSFADQYLGDDGCVELCRVLHPFIARSSASPATASASSSAAPASAGQLATITALDLRGNDISTVGARAIADVMRIATSIRRYADAVL